MEVAAGALRPEPDSRLLLLQQWALRRKGRNSRSLPNRIWDRKASLNSNGRAGRAQSGYAEAFLASGGLKKIG